jgi:hypothetical protein
MVVSLTEPLIVVSELSRRFLPLFAVLSLIYIYINLFAFSI